jgi:hypothetical protein
MLTTPGSGSRLLFYGSPDGHLEVEADANGAIVIGKHFQRLGNVAGRWAILTLMRSAKGLSFYLSGKEADDYEGTEGPVLELPEERAPPPFELAIGHARARARCAPSMRERRLWLSNQIQRPRRGSRRPKSDAEQVQELRGAIVAIDEFLQRIRSGVAGFADDLVARLRALIYWNPGNRNYNPLLLRFAAQRNLPLPVFAMPQTNRWPKIVGQAEQHLQVNYPTPIRRFPGQRLMDLQAYLATPIQIDRSGTWTPAAGGTTGPDDRQSVNDVIGDAASTIGSAHYDDTVPVALDRLRETRAMDTDVLIRLLVGIGLEVGELARYVVREHEKALSSRRS